MLCDSEEVILSEERTTDEEKMKIIEGKCVQLSHASLVYSTFFLCGEITVAPATLNDIAISSPTVRSSLSRAQRQNSPYRQKRDWTMEEPGPSKTQSAEGGGYRGTVSS